MQSDGADAIEVLYPLQGIVFLSEKLETRMRKGWLGAMSIKQWMAAAFVFINFSSGCNSLLFERSVKMVLTWIMCFVSGTILAPSEMATAADLLVLVMSFCCLVSFVNEISALCDWMKAIGDKCQENSSCSLGKVAFTEPSIKKVTQSRSTIGFSTIRNHAHTHSISCWT